MGYYIALIINVQYQSFETSRKAPSDTCVSVSASDKTMYAKLRQASTKKRILCARNRCTLINPGNALDLEFAE